MYKQILGGLLAITVAVGVANDNTAEASFSSNNKDGEKLIAFLGDESKGLESIKVSKPESGTGLDKFAALGELQKEKSQQNAVKAKDLSSKEVVKASSIKVKEENDSVKDVNKAVVVASAKTEKSPTATDLVGETILDTQNKISKAVNQLEDEKTTKAEVVPAIASENAVLPEVLSNLLEVNPLEFESTDVSQIANEVVLKSEQVVRTEANEDGDILTFVPEESSVEILDEKTEDGWYKVKYEVEVSVEKEGKVKTEKKEVVGFVNLDYIPVVEEEVKEEVVSTHEQDLKTIENNLLTAIDQEIAAEKAEAERQARLEEERKARLEAQRQARLAAERANAQRSVTSSSSKSTTSSSGAVSTSASNANSSSIMAQATRYLGTPYVYGASPSTTRAFDCSSFTQRVFKNLGISLPRTASTQARVGQSVSKANLQVGDLVFFTTNGRGTVSHVGIYAGNGKFIGAQTSGGVSYGNLNDSYWGPKYMGAKRVH